MDTRDFVDHYIAANGTTANTILRRAGIYLIVGIRDSENHVYYIGSSREGQWKPHFYEVPKWNFEVQAHLFLTTKFPFSLLAK